MLRGQKLCVEAAEWAEPTGERPALRCAQCEFRCRVPALERPRRTAGSRWLDDRRAAGQLWHAGLAQSPAPPGPADRSLQSAAARRCIFAARVWRLKIPRKESLLQRQARGPAGRILWAKVAPAPGTAEL